MTISAKVVLKSVGPEGHPVTTMQLRYPKFIHGELMTHRVFSRNASSSRAIPVERLIRDVIDDPVYPSFWGKNQPGMSAKEEHDESVGSMTPFEVNPEHEVGKLLIKATGTKPDDELVIAKKVLVGRKEAWDAARHFAIVAAGEFARAGYHKQIINRLLEPFCHINVVVTSTEWSNFFALRCHPDAQPEMCELASKMKAAHDTAPLQVLDYGKWHLPYVDPKVDGPMVWEYAIKISVARCARVSYLTQEGKPPVVTEDLKLYERLVGGIPLHASPAEHQASPDSRRPNGEWDRPELHGNFKGWVQYRKTLQGENQ